MYYFDQVVFRILSFYAAGLRSMKLLSNIFLNTFPVIKYKKISSPVLSVIVKTIVHNASFQLINIFKSSLLHLGRKNLTPIERQIKVLKIGLHVSLTFYFNTSDFITTNFSVLYVGSITSRG